MNNFSRATSAFVLAASLLMSSVAALAQTTTNKSTDQTEKTTQTQSEENKTQTEQKADQKAAAQPAATAVKSSGKTLSTNEDPNMIGKRNINTGIIAKMSGSTEKEVRMGREAAAEVDRQAKFVDDPLITEYVNRVGQNIVLHSDAKFPSLSKSSILTK